MEYTFNFGMWIFFPVFTAANIFIHIIHILAAPVDGEKVPLLNLKIVCYNFCEKKDIGFKGRTQGSYG